MKRKMLVGLWMSLSISLNAMMAPMTTTRSESENKCNQALIAMIGQSSILGYHRKSGLMYTPVAIKNTKKIVLSMIIIENECAKEIQPPRIGMYREALELEIKTAEMYMKIEKLKRIQDK